MHISEKLTTTHDLLSYSENHTRKPRKMNATRAASKAVVTVKVSLLPIFALAAARLLTSKSKNHNSVSFQSSENSRKLKLQASITLTHAAKLCLLWIEKRTSWTLNSNRL